MFDKKRGGMGYLKTAVQDIKTKEELTALESKLFELYRLEGTEKKFRFSSRQIRAALDAVRFLRGGSVKETAKLRKFIGKKAMKIV